MENNTKYIIFLTILKATSRRDKKEPTHFFAELRSFLTEQIFGDATSLDSDDEVLTEPEAAGPNEVLRDRQRLWKKVRSGVLLNEVLGKATDRTGAKE